MAKYINEKINSTEVAKFYCCNPLVIQRIIKKYNATRSPFLFSKKQEKEIIDLYIFDKISAGKISKLFTCDEKTILKILKRANLVRTWSEAKKIQKENGFNFIKNIKKTNK